MDFLAPKVSDHSPAFIQLVHVLYSPPKPFKFFNFWANHPEFQTFVKESWKEPMCGSPMVLLHGKLKRLKHGLKDFNKIHFSDISLKVKAKRNELAGIQEALLSHNPSAELVFLEKSLTLELYNLIKEDENFYKQKSRIQWIKKGIFFTSL